MSTLLSAGHRVENCLRLGGVERYAFVLAVPLAWSLADWRGAGPLLLFGLGLVCVLAASGAFDAVVAYRDGRRRDLGSDGVPTESDAVRVGWALLGAGAVLWALAVLAGAHRPEWLIGLLALGLITSVPGPRIDCPGLAEAVIGAFGIGIVLCATGLVGEITGFAAVQAVLFGLGPLLITLYANLGSAPADLAAGRRTAAVAWAGTGYSGLVAGLSVSQIALVVSVAGLGPAPWWFALAMSPALFLLVSQLRAGVGIGDPAAAVRAGRWTHLVTVGLLMAVNLLTGSAR